MSEPNEELKDGSSSVPTELVSFLEQNPAYYPVFRSNLCILLLKSISEKAKNLTMLKAEFPKLSQEDLSDLVHTLVSVGAVSYFDAGSNRFFYINDSGRFFLSIYEHAKEEFVGLSTD
ncbi:MAG: hypothetical protein QXK06_02425 [Candidatus Diapherotrites archaeon]